jgi:hypothetical protein
MGNHKHYECNTLFGVLHNEVFKDNIMLHFLLNKPNIVYIIIGDWGEVGRLQEVTPSLYGFIKEQHATNIRKMCRGWPYDCFFCLQ